MTPGSVGIFAPGHARRYRGLGVTWRARSSPVSRRCFWMQCSQANTFGHSAEVWYLQVWARRDGAERGTRRKRIHGHQRRTRKR
eukprot:6997553-Pyramimonas_sp.AAC.4